MDKFLFGFAAGLFIMLLVIVQHGTPSYHYKQGQIDAINGVIKYELVVQPDSTSEWIKIEK